MRTTPPRLTLVVIALLLASHIFIQRWCLQLGVPRGWPDWPYLLFFPLLEAEGLLLSAWLALGASPGRWRLAAAAVAAVVQVVFWRMLSQTAVPVVYLRQSSAWPEATMTLGALAIQFVALRLLLADYRPATAPPASKVAATYQPRYTTWWLLVLITVSSCLLAMGNVPRGDVGEILVAHPVENMVLSALRDDGLRAPWVAVACLSLLGAQISWTGLAAALGLAVGMACVSEWYNAGPITWWCVVGEILTLLVATAALFAYRAAGVRLRRSSSPIVGAQHATPAPVPAAFDSLA